LKYGIGDMQVRPETPGVVKLSATLRDDLRTSILLKATTNIL
jgi:hypothetical protein